MRTNPVCSGGVFGHIFMAGLAALAATPHGVAQETAPTAREVFEKRIMPIFQSPNPSSCVQCHLAGVDLKHYILPSSEMTFLSLRDQGLIDLDRPADSKILRLIRMGDEDRRAAALIHERTRRAEHEAFAAWIVACCKDAKLRAGTRLAKEELATPPRPPEVIRYARTDRLLESFERTVWALRFRCMNCHIEGSPQNDKLRKEHGDRVAWTKKEGARATMDYLLGSKLIDLETPEKSLLLLKPLGEVKHGGGIKFLPGDQGYKAFRAWIEDVAAVRGDKYARAADLPPKEAGPLRFGTEVWLKLADTPDAWANKLLQVNLYEWDVKKQAWAEEPVATSDRGVGKARVWQHNLTLLAARGTERAEVWKRGKPTLPPGRYLVRVYVDREARLARDWKATLSEDDYVGQAEFEARWREGYGGMTVVDARKVRR